MGVASSSSARIKCLVSANSKKISGIQEARDILLRSPLELPKTHYLPCKEAVVKQGLSCLCRSWDQTERIVHLSSNHDSSAKPRTVKRGADSMLQVTAKRAARAKDGEQSCLDLPPAQSEQSNVVDAKAVEEQIVDEAVMEEDNSQGGIADKARPNAKEQAGEAVETPLSSCSGEQLVCNGGEARRLPAYVGDITLGKDSIEFVLLGAACLQWRRGSSPASVCQGHNAWKRLH
ncbi:unnamed protein product [Prunus brigantina]